MTLSEYGLWQHLDTLIRDPTVSEQVKFVIVNGEAGELLQKNFRAFPRTGKYIDRLIEKESKGQTIPETTLYSFTRDYYDDGIDPVAPIIKDDGESIIVDGIGIFRGDKYVGKINPKDSLIFAFLRNSFKQGEISIDLSEGAEENETVMLNSLNSKKKIEVVHTPTGRPNIVIHVKVKASVQEYTGDLKLSEEADRRKLEQEISEVTSKQADRLVTYMQQRNADSLGIGTFVRNSMSHKAWKQFHWADAFPNVNIQCRIVVKIKDYGFRR